MWKTPDETKKSLECCYSSVEPIMRCEQCPYYGSVVCKMHLHTDALAFIQQLQAENAEQAERIQQLEAERDAAVEELSEKTELAKTLKMKFDQLVKEWRELEKMLRRGVQKEAAT